MGQPNPQGLSFDESIVEGSKPGELKHLSSRRKGHQTRLREEWRAKADQASGRERSSRTAWKGGPKRVTAPYAKQSLRSSSRAGHVQSCLNMGGPPSKPKYSSVTDSAPVP